MTSTESTTFRIQGGGLNACAEIRGGVFVVLAGSQARAEAVPSLANHSYGALRAQLLTSGQLQPDPANGHLIFPQDTEFRSSSAAAAAVLGRAANGKVEWVQDTESGEGRSYGEWLTENPAVPAGASVQVLPTLEAAEADWPEFFRQLVEKLLEYQARQPALVEMLRIAGVQVPTDEGMPLKAMDPFSFLGLLVKHRDEKRLTQMLGDVGRQLGLSDAPPVDFTGLPWSMAMKPLFFAYRSERAAGDVDLLWTLARQAQQGNLNAGTFEGVLRIRNVGLPKLTQGLFWINPEEFLALNSVNVPYLKSLGVKKAGQVKTLLAYHNVLQAARPLAPNYLTLSHAAWLAAQADKSVARLEDGAFPFEAFQEDAARFTDDRANGNTLLDRKYAPLLLDIVGDVPTRHLSASRSPYSGREQLAVKVSLGGGVKAEGGTFGRALLYAENGFEYVPFPPGLTLEVGLSDGKGDGPRRALRQPELRAELQSALLRLVQTTAPATLTLNSDFTTPKLLPLHGGQEAELAQLLDAYVQGTGKSRRLRVGVSLNPEELQSGEFLGVLDNVLGYLDHVASVLERLNALSDEIEVEPEVIEASGQEEAPAPLEFVAAPRVPLNKILYGPPGTGKTYRVVDEALAALDPECLRAHMGPEGRAARKARYDELVAEGRISFVTFHQSFGYEDFIEGLKPVIDQSGNLNYRLEDGIFLQAVKAAGGLQKTVNEPEPPSSSLPAGVRADGQVWRLYIDGTAPVSAVRERSVSRGEIRVGSWLSGNGASMWRLPGTALKPVDLNILGEDQLNPQQLAFKDAVRVGDVVLLAAGQDRISAIGVVTDEYRFDPDSDPVFAPDYAHARSVQWLAQGLSLSAQTVTGKQFAPPTLQRVAGATPASVLKHLPAGPSPAQAARTAPLQPHVLIIDEINRGNISKIFGELITLLEDSKRAGAKEALSATLPLSRRTLSIPRSLYVIGTMNTADRSLTLLDAALRRRFVFRPVWPEPQVLPVMTFPDGAALDLRKFLYAINDRIERLLSREQVIGHAYLLGLPASLDGVANAVRERILPLLEEYFFEDWGKIREVLADGGKPEALQFIHQVKAGGETRYRLNEKAFGELEAFTGVYNRLDDAFFPFDA